MPAKETAKLPGAIRRELYRRIKEGEATLRELRIRPNIWRQLVALVRWTRDGATIDPAGHMERALVRDLGERHTPLSEPVGPPTQQELHAEVERLMAEGETHARAELAAPITFLQRRLGERGDPPRLMREPLAWEAATSAAIAAAALENPIPEVLSATRQTFERLDDARRFDDKKTALEEVRGWRATGGRAAARQRASEHREKIAGLRTEYQGRLAAEKSPDIIGDMAQRYGYTVEHLRRLIRPRELKNLRGR